MASMRDAMVRNLKHFVDNFLGGVTTWEQVGVSIPKDLEGDVVQVRFGRHLVQIESPEYNVRFPCGRVSLNDQTIGPIDEASWKMAANLIRDADGRQSDGIAR